MKQLFLVATAMLLSMTLIAGCGATAAPAAPAASVLGAALPVEISIEQAAAQRDAGAFILDVREPSEWNEFHVPGSTLIPLGQLQARVNEVPKDKPVVVVCRSGNRSQVGRDVLKQAGFENVTSMKGGLTQWKNQGLPTVSGP
jgi:rhodanese-related sulfurtransferase